MYYTPDISVNEYTELCFLTRECEVCDEQVCNGVHVPGPGDGHHNELWPGGDLQIALNYERQTKSKTFVCVQRGDKNGIER
jgi:hypothetical protein